MKSMSKFLIVILSTVLFLSCKKSDPGTGASGSGTMTAKVDGVAWSGTLAVQASKSGGVLTFAGTGPNGQINMVVGNYNGPGTYTIGATGGPANQGIFAITTAPFTAHTASFVLGSGTIVVSTDNGTGVTGTFSFDGKNNSGPSITTKVITEGNFNINF